MQLSCSCHAVHPACRAACVKFSGVHNYQSLNPTPMPHLSHPQVTAEPNIVVVSACIRCKLLLENFIIKEGPAVGSAGVGRHETCIDTQHQPLVLGKDKQSKD